MNDATTPTLTFVKIQPGRHQVLLFGKPIGTVRYEAACWWAYDLQGDKIQGGHGTARQAASFLTAQADEDRRAGRA